MENTPESMQNWGVRLENWINRQTWNFAQHWLVWVNGLIGIFVGLPYLAPILMSAGFTTAAAMIYRAYSVTCHQMPERSFFIFGYKAAFCQRDTAIWLAMFGGGMLFPLVRKRLQSLPPHWWILALIPIGLDGGTQLVGPLYQVLPPWGLTGFAVVVGVGLTVMLYKNHVSHWQYYLFVLCFPLAMGFVHLTGPRLSIWQLRTLTGTIFGLANVWLVFPMLEESFAEIRRDFADRFGG